MPWTLFAQCQKNTQMTKLVVTNTYYTLVKVMASCTVWAIEPQMEFSMGKHKPCISKYAILISIYLHGLHCLLPLRTDILGLQQIVLLKCQFIAHEQ